MPWPAAPSPASRRPPSPPPAAPRSWRPPGSGRRPRRRPARRPGPTLSASSWCNLQVRPARRGPGHVPSARPPGSEFHLVLLHHLAPDLLGGLAEVLPAHLPESLLVGSVAVAQVPHGAVIGDFHVAGDRVVVTVTPVAV